MNYSTTSSPALSNPKINAFDNPQFLNEKRKVYGQYKSSPRYNAPDEKYSKTSQSPRKAAIVPEYASENIVLESCEH